MEIDVAGKVIVVTGAAQGIGRTLALGLAADGARVGCWPVTASAHSSSSTRSPHLPMHRRHWGRVDALINNAGWMPGRHPVLEIDVAVLERVLQSNLVGAFVATKHFAPLMIRGGGGRIIYVSSIAGVQSTAGGAAYGGAKAALNILTNVVHQELADDGIRTVAIAPGLTYTPGMREIITEDHIERVAAAYPGGRLGQPEDIVALTTFLCSEAASHISGTVITVRPPVTG